jgi:hypothetical protein
MTSVAEIGYAYCKPDKLETLGQQPNKTDKYDELYTFLKNLCFAATFQLEASMTEQLVDMDDNMLSISTFKPLLQLHLYAGYKSEYQLRDLLIYSFTKVGNSLARMLLPKVTGHQTEQTLIKMLHSLFTKSMMPSNMTVETIQFSLCLAELLQHLLQTFSANDGISEEEVQVIAELQAQWHRAVSNRSDSATFQYALESCQMKLMKIRLFMLMLSHLMNSKLYECDMRADIIARANLVVKAISSIPCDAISQQLQRIQDSHHGTNAWSKTGTNMHMLGTFLFWVEKTLEVQIMKYELVQPIEGRLEKPTYLSEPFLVTLVLSLDWIEEVGCTVSTMHSIFQSFNRINGGSEVDERFAWLSAKSQYAPCVMFGVEEQEKATQIMQEVSLQWKAEYDRRIHNEVYYTETSKNLPNVFRLLSS